MKQSDNQTNLLLEDLIVKVGHVSGSIDCLADKANSVAFEVEQSSAHRELAQIAEQLSNIDIGINDISNAIESGNDQASTMAEKLSDIAEILKCLAHAKPDTEA